MAFSDFSLRFAYFSANSESEEYPVPPFRDAHALILGCPAPSPSFLSSFEESDDDEDDEEGVSESDFFSSLSFVVGKTSEAARLVAQLLNFGCSFVDPSVVGVGGGDGFPFSVVEVEGVVVVGVEGDADLSPRGDKAALLAAQLLSFGGSLVVDPSVVVVVVDDDADVDCSCTNFSLSFDKVSALTSPRVDRRLLSRKEDNPPLPHPDDDTSKLMLDHEGVPLDLSTSSASS